MNEYYKPFRTLRKLENFQRGAKMDWYRIENKATGPSQVHIYDEIGGLGVSADNFISDLSNVAGDLEIHLNTPGGEVFDGLAIYNSLKQRTGNVSIIVDALAASIGSVIAMAASPGKLIMAKNASLMIHDGFGMGMGNAADMRKLADLLDQCSDNIASIYAERTGMAADHWRNAMQQETWYNAQQAVSSGLADAVQGSDVKNGWDLSSLYNNAPDMHGDHVRIDPDGDGDCDACPEGDTDHDYWDADGNQIQPLPGEASNLSTFNPQNASVDNSPWDGSKAMANGAAASDPAAFYAGICAGKKAGNPHNQSSWALPYKYHPGDAPNAAGVKNALARLPQTEDLTNKAEAQATLEKAMKQVNPDYEPSDEIDVHALQALFTQSLGRGK